MPIVSTELSEADYAALVKKHEQSGLPTLGHTMAEAVRAFAPPRAPLVEQHDDEHG